MFINGSFPSLDLQRQFGWDVELTENVFLQQKVSLRRNKHSNNIEYNRGVKKCNQTKQHVH